MGRNTLHITVPVSLLREAYRALGTGGTAEIIHRKYAPAILPGPSLAIRPTLTLEQCRAWAEEAGFECVRTENLCSS